MIYTTDVLGYQWDVFLGAIVLGFLLGGCFTALRMGMIIFRFGVRISKIFDFLFWVFGGFIIFSFLLNENFGIPRYYIFLGIGAGFYSFWLVFGKPAKKAAKIIGKVIRRFLSPFERIFRKFTAKAKINLAKLIDIGKSLLKKSKGLVYNILCLNILKAFSFCGEKAGKEPGKVESNGTEKNEEKHFYQNRSYCIRGISSVHPDINAGEHQRKT